MTNDAGALATALYAAPGDMLKEHPGLAPWRPPAGTTTSVRSDDVWVVDSTPVERGRSRETVK